MCVAYVRSCGISVCVWVNRYRSNSRCGFARAVLLRAACEVSARQMCDSSSQWQIGACCDTLSVRRFVFCPLSCVTTVEKPTKITDFSDTHSRVEEYIGTEPYCGFVLIGRPAMCSVRAMQPTLDKSRVWSKEDLAACVSPVEGVCKNCVC